MCLCIECNVDCDVCSISCPDKHRICENCNSNCSVFDVEKFTDLANGKSDNETLIVHINARSLSQNLGKIEEVLDTLKVSA